VAVENERFTVVENFEQTAAVAEATDPRAPRTADPAGSRFSRREGTANRDKHRPPFARRRRLVRRLIDSLDRDRLVRLRLQGNVRLELSDDEAGALFEALWSLAKEQRPCSLQSRARPQLAPDRCSRAARVPAHRRLA
jgi:hypothetical protein